MEEIVKYKNEINTLKFKGFTKTDMNLFIALCAKMKDCETNEITFEFDYLKQITSYTSTDTKDFISDLDRMNDKLSKITARFETDDEIVRFTLFPVFVINKKNLTLTVSVNPKFAYLLNNVITSFTIFDLQEFIRLDSKYSKNLYRILKQWRTQGQYIFHNLEEFRELMDIPTKYTNKYMMNECVAVAVEEIQKLDKSFQDFECTPIYARKRGKPLEKLMFTWKAETTKQQENQLQGQASFTDIQTFDEYMKGYQGADKPTPVELKIAKDIVKGKKKKAEEPKTNKFNNFNQRNYDFDEFEKVLLTTNPNN